MQMRERANALREKEKVSISLCNLNECKHLLGDNGHVPAVGKAEIRLIGHW